MLHTRIESHKIRGENPQKMCDYLKLAVIWPFAHLKQNTKRPTTWVENTNGSTCGRGGDGSAVPCLQVVSAVTPDEVCSWSVCAAGERPCAARDKMAAVPTTTSGTAGRRRRVCRDERRRRCARSSTAVPCMPCYTHNRTT